MLAVFDGHGGSATATLASQVCAALANRIVTVESEKSALGSKYWTTAMRSMFEELDAFVIQSAPYERGAWSGAAACIVLITPFELISANAGDSRSVRWFRGKAVRLSRDHTPHEDKEDTIRVTSLGGTVDEQGYVRFPSHSAPGSLAGLAMTRSLGDKEGKLGSARNHIISAKPHVAIARIQPGPIAVVVASDGLWDVMSDTEACTVAQDTLRMRMDPSCMLVMGALGMWADQRVSKDNICCVVAHHGSWDDRRASPALSSPASASASASAPSASSVLSKFSKRDAAFISSICEKGRPEHALQTALRVTANQVATKTHIAPPIDAMASTARAGTGHTKPAVLVPSLARGIAPGGFAWIRTDTTHILLAEYAKAASAMHLPCVEPVQLGDESNPVVRKIAALLPRAERPPRSAVDVRWADFSYNLRTFDTK